MSAVVKWLIVGWLALGALLSITSVGKPRKPMTPAMAAVIVAVCAFEIVLIIVFWGVS